MPTINLGNGYRLYIPGRSFTCSKGEYNDFKLFRKCNYELKSARPGCIYLYKTSNGSTSYLALRNPCHKLENVDVYFNKHENKTPLLFVLHFQNGVPPITNRYYRMSCYAEDAKDCKTKKINELCQYNSESDILCALIQQNDRLDQVLTYDIMRRPNGNGGTGPCTYNCQKIQVTKDTNGDPKLTNGFTRYVHKPANNNGGHKDKKACLVYRCQALLKEGDQELEQIQNQQYGCVKVYFGDKAKRPCTTKGTVPGVCVCTEGAKGDTCKPGQGSTCSPTTTSASGNTCPACPATPGGTNQWQDVPLMLELHKQPCNGGDGASNNTDYYVHRRKTNGKEGGNGDQYYWVKLTLTNGQGNGPLKQLLSDIGLSEQQQEQNGKLTDKLGQRANGSNGTGPALLELLLKRLEFDLTDSVVILMDKRNGSSSLNGGYGDTQISGAISNLQPKGQTGINPLKLNGDSNGNKITVSDNQNGLCQCLTKHKYRVVEHSFQSAVTKLTSGCSAGLRFLMPTRDGNAVDGGGNGTKYAQLKLYPKSTQTQAQHLEYKYYTRNGGSAHNCAKVYVVFYKGDGNGGTESDPRPLLLCYNKEVYRATSKEGYDAQQWVKVDGLTTGKCLCQNGPDNSNGKNDTLLTAVTKVVGFLNPVRLHIVPKSKQTCRCYYVHEFNGCVIRLKVTSKAVAGSSCYKQYVHRHIGISCNGDGFRLGNVEYCSNTGSSRKGKIDYYNGTNGDLTAKNKWAPLQSVTVYYYNQDTKYCDPLLVVLEFAKNGLGSSNTEKECYCLTSANGSKLTWAKDEQACKTVLDDGAQLAKHLDAIRYCLKFTVRIHLECRTGQYPLKGRNGKEGKGDFSKTINGAETQVQVEVCEVKCDALTEGKYKCFKHGLTQALNGHQDKVAGLAFTLPCQKDGGAGQSACCVNGSTGQNGFVEIPVCVVGQGEAKCPPVTGAQAGCTAEEGQGAAICPAVTPGAGTCPASPSTAGTIPPVYYNSCMGDVCVYFYACKNGGSEACGVSTDATGSGSCSPKNNGKNGDTVPLMVKFNGQFYAPCDRDSYFTKWACVTELCKKTGTCNCPCCGTGAGTECTDQCGPECTCCSQLVTQLDKVNLALNRIDLDRSSLANGSSTTSNGSSKGYGLPEKNGSGTKLHDSVGNVRVCLTKQTPKGDGKTAYVRVIHRTKNGFRIGCITYCGKDFATDGVTLDFKQGGECNGVGSSEVGAACPSTSSSASSDCTIKVANGSSQKHTALVSSCGWNTVVAYYSCSDKDKKLPQLIVILKTDNPVSNGEPVTVSGDKYGYYILAAQNGVNSGGSGYEYKWVEVNGKEAPSVTLNDETDFSLLNAAIILLEQRDKGTGGNCTYGEGEIKKAVASAIKKQPKLKSPGNKDDVNRLKGKTIEVKDETSGTGSSAGAGTCASSGDGTSSGVCCCKCLTDTGFKVMAHCLDQLVELDPPLKTTLSEVKLIAGLKLLIPTSTKVVYKQVKLVDNGTAAETGAPNGLVKYHKNGNNKICVYFYGSDPRPLMVCYNGWAYAARSMEEYNKQQWHKDAEAGECNCTQAPGTCEKCKLLTELVRVSDFLNPVDIKLVPMSGQYCKWYSIHTFNGRKIWIRVSSQFACGSFCFDRFTHTHYGTGRGGTGFRLGDIYHGKNCIKENGSSSNTGANGKCISASDIDDTSNKHRASPEVVVFYYRGDKDRRNPLLVALKSHDQGTNGKYKPYFELQKKFDQGQPKLYKKNDNGDGLDLRDTNPNGQLAKTLDAILYRISKYLRVVLSQRPVPRDYKASSDKNGHITDVFKAKGEKTPSDKDPGKQLFDVNVKMLEKMAESADEASKSGKPSYTTRDALMHHVLRETKYQAQLCDNGPSGSPPSSPPTETTITVTEVDCTEIHSIGGYRCFQHLLTQAKGIEQVGGLKLYLWADGQGTPSAQEITLCTGGTNGTTNGKIDIEYTTCKGDLYVFFYGGIFQKLDLKKVSQNNLVSHIFISKTFFKKDFKQQKSKIINTK